MESYTEFVDFGTYTIQVMERAAGPVQWKLYRKGRIRAKGCASNTDTALAAAKTFAWADILDR